MTCRRKRRGTWMNFVRRITAGLGIVRRSDRTTRSESDSTISALPSITSRSARRIGTIVSGSYDAFRARQPSTTKLPLPLFEDRHTDSPSTAAGELRRAVDAGAPKLGQTWGYGRNCMCRKALQQPIQTPATRQDRIPLQSFHCRYGLVSPPASSQSASASPNSCILAASSGRPAVSRPPDTSGFPATATNAA